MSDPLSLVRQANIAGTAITFVDNNYVFGTYKFPGSTKTCFKRTLKADDYYYTLRDVLFFMENIEIGVADYRRMCVEMKIMAVVEQDKQSMKSYLLGEISTCSQLDLSVAAAFNAAAPSASSSQQSGASSASSLRISASEMQEQRSRHAALIDQSLQKSASSSTSGAASNKLDDLKALRKAQKRKLTSLEEDGGAFDPAFLKADRQLLSELRSGELASHTRVTVLSKPAADFSFALKLFNDHVLKPKDSKSARPNQEATATSASAAAAAPATNTRVFSTPIIIVPAILTSLISSLNVADFLERSNYVTNEQKRADGAKREPVILIRRTLPSGQVCEYKVVDSVTNFQDRDWDRVVAVFVTGQDWQFKDWKWTRPVELFNKLLGIHVTMDDRLVDQKVMDWNCKIIKIKQFKRHYDAGVVNEFWSHVDNFIKTHKPWLQPPLKGGAGHHSVAKA